jgi:molybdopterin-binding protein
MRLSARNQLEGKIIAVDNGPIHAKVKMRLAGGQEITAIISAEAVDELGLVPGKRAFAIVKAQNVMVGVDH